MSITVTRTLPEKKWNRFVREHPDGNIFHSPEMFQVFARTTSYKPTLWAALDAEERLLALLLPVEITLMNGLLRWFTTRAVAYGSVLCVPSPDGEQALKLLLQLYQREVKGHVLFTELRNLSDLSPIQLALNECGFTYEEHLNFLVDIARPQEEIWKGIRSNARRNIKKARKSQVVISEVSEPGQVTAAYAILKNTYERLQVPLADSTLFRAAFETLHSRDMFKILVSQLDDVDIGVSTLLLYKDVVYYWYAGIVREYAPYRAGDLLVWHALDWGSQNGFRVFDFGGAGKPDEEYGVRAFKAKYNGELVNYGRNICIHAPQRLKLSQKGYELMRRFL